MSVATSKRFHTGWKMASAHSAASLPAFCAVFASAGIVLAETPRVTRVVLHPDGAVIVRAGVASCEGGTGVARFPELPPTFDPDSARASVGEAGASVVGLAVAEVLRAEPYDKDVAAIDERLEALGVEQAELGRALESADAMRGRADTLRSQMVAFLQREAAAAPKPNVEAWKSALAQSRTMHAKALEARRKGELRLEEVNEEIERLTEKRERLDGAEAKRSFEVEVVVNCGGKSKVPVELLATTPLATWTPSFEARADGKGGNVNLTVRAEAVNRSGEWWRDVSVELSTSLARRDARPPLMSRLVIGANERKEVKQVIVSRQEVQQHVSEGSTTREASAIAIEDTGLSVKLKVPGVAELPGDGRPARLSVETLALGTTFGLVTIPRLQPYAYRAATVRNTARYPLLPGPVDLFTESGLIGTWRLPRTAEGATVRLSFGVDESVQVKRTILAEDKLEPGFLQSTKRMVYGYRIELKNAAKFPQTVTLQEPVAVSEVDDVKVKVDDKKTTPGGKLDAVDGVYAWDVVLKAGETRTIELHFDVEIPSKYETAGL